MKTESERVKRAYDRIAPFFDLTETLLEGLLFSRLREKFWRKASGKKILEIGVGTGKNFPYYPPETIITAIDFSEQMLKLSRRKAADKNIAVDLKLMDAEKLEFADNSFDTVIATFVFCSVPYPKAGLEEIYRVCKPGGKMLLLEHVISSNLFLAMLMNFLNPVIASLFGANINRNTVATVKNSGFINITTDNEISGDIIKAIEAEKPR